MIKVSLLGGPFDGSEIVTAHLIAPPRLRFKVPVMPPMSWWDVSGEFTNTLDTADVWYELLDPWVLDAAGAYVYCWAGSS